MLNDQKRYALLWSESRFPPDSQSDNEPSRQGQCNSPILSITNSFIHRFILGLILLSVDFVQARQNFMRSEMMNANLPTHSVWDAHGHPNMPDKQEKRKGIVMASNQTSRRSFLKGAALSGACVAAAGAAVAQAEEQAEAQFDKQTDVLVLGAGTGGCFAANYAMQQGAQVIVVEASPKVGGTAILSGGFYHTWDINEENVDQMLASADAHKRQVFIQKWQEVCNWVLNESGLEASPLDLDYPLYGAHLIGFAIGGADMAAGRQRFLESVVEGAEVILDTYLEDLILDESDAVIGAVVRGKDGTVTRIGAKATIIATGSFQNNKGMIEEHLGRWADCAICRASTYNKGTGINLALKYGARLSKGTGHFYGHLNPWPALTPSTEEEYDAFDPDLAQSIMGAIQKFSVEGIAVNTNGLRFTDEGPENYVGDNYLANDALQEMDGNVWSIIDSAQDHESELSVISDNGGIVITADTVDELAEQLTAYKVNPYNLKKTIAEYQEAAAAGTTMELTIPKSPMPTDYLTKLDTPPFHAVRASAGISGFYGGIDTTDNGEVYGDGDQIIPGLYAAPMASGGVFYKEYGGGLALCVTFGAVAGKAAGEYVKA